MKMWIARDKCGGLFLYDSKPYRDNNQYKINEGLFMGINGFPEVTFENSPMEVELKLI